MSVHHLCVASGGDLVVLLPRSLALLLRELRSSAATCCCLSRRSCRRLSPDICCA